MQLGAKSLKCKSASDECSQHYCILASSRLSDKCKHLQKEGARGGSAKDMKCKSNMNMRNKPERFSSLRTLDQNADVSITVYTSRSWMF